MSAITIADNVYSVGVKDSGLRVFDITMPTEHGTTYNAFLIKGDKVALIDTVKKEFAEEFLNNVREIVPLDQIDYLVVNHTEPDHSGAIPALLEANDKIEIICGKAAIPYVKAVINRSATITGVKDKHELDLGGKSLTFRLMPYMHWPDTMMEFLSEDGILFSNDGFAGHICGDSIWADEYAIDVAHEVKYYFDCIMRPFTGFIRRNMSKLDDYHIKVVAPSHGPLFRNDPLQFINGYKEWSADKAEGKEQITIFYASNYGNTKRIADELAGHLQQQGFTTCLTDADGFDETIVKDQIESSIAVVIGTPTFNGDAVIPIWNLVNQFSTVYSIGKKAAVFGSYGWGGEGAKLVAARLAGLKLKVMEEQYRARLIPSNEELTDLSSFAEQFTEFVRGGK